MFMRVSQVGDVVSAGPTLVSSLRPHLQGGLLSLGAVLLTVLPASVLLSPAVLLPVLAVLPVLALLLLLLQGRCIRL